MRAQPSFVATAARGAASRRVGRRADGDAAADAGCRSPSPARRRRRCDARAGRRAAHHRRAGHRAAQPVRRRAICWSSTAAPTRGVQLGQQFFVRRANDVRRQRPASATPGHAPPAGSASSPSTSRRRSPASITPAARILAGDYLEPFVAAGRAGRRRSRRDARRARLHVARARSSIGNEDRSDRGRRRLRADRSRARDQGVDAGRALRDLSRRRRRRAAARQRRRSASSSRSAPTMALGRDHARARRRLHAATTSRSRK